MDADFFKEYLKQQAAKEAKRDEEREMFMQMFKELKTGSTSGTLPAHSASMPGAKEQLVSSLSLRLEPFLYNPDDGQVFDKWYSRYGAIIEEDGKCLEEKDKVRILLGKLAGGDFRRFSEALEPAEPYSKPYDETLKILKKLFGQTRSLVVRRYECFKIAQTAIQDDKDYAARVNTPSFL